MTKRVWRKRLTCGQMARANCITEKTLRFYQQKGLLEPADVNQDTGFRYYDILQSTKLDLVSHLRVIGFSLDEIRAIDESKDIDELLAQTRLHLAQIQEQQKTLAIAERLARDVIGDCTAYQNAPLFNQIMIEHVDERFWLTFDFSQLDDQNIAAGLNASDLWEWRLRAVKGEIIRRGWPPSLFRNVGYTTTVQAIYEADPENPMMMDAIGFVYVDPSFGDCFQQAQPATSGLMLTMYVNNGYGDEGQSLDRERFLRMLDYAEGKHLMLNGDPFCESICRFPRLLNQSYETYTRYCVPVKRTR